MAFLPGIFGTKTPPAPQAPQPGAASTQQTPVNPGANPAAMQNTPAQPPAAGPQSPLDAFTGMFQPAPVDPNAPKQLGIHDPFLGALDPKQLRERVATANFTSGISAEKMSQAMQDPAIFAEVINSAAREAFAAATQMSHQMVESGTRVGLDRLNGSLDSRIRDFQVRSQNTTNPALSHPAVAPMLMAVKAQIANANPGLTPEAIQQQAEQYFTQMADVLTAPKQAEAAKAAAPKPGTDFSSYLDLGN